MRSVLFILILCGSALVTLGQEPIKWSDEVNLSLGDFRSPQTEINPSLNSYSVNTGNRIEFSFQMSSMEFMFTKNFNEKVLNHFYPEASVITAVDSAMAARLVYFASYAFDLSELYARRFRQQLYEQKGVFSNVSYYQPIYEQLQKEMNAELARVQKATDLGENSELLNAERLEVRKAINELADFCESCKPPKKKKS